MAVTPSASPPPPARWPAPRLHAMQVAEAFRVLPWVAGYGFVASLLVFGVLAASGEGARAGLWLLGGFLVALARGVLILLRHRRVAEADTAPWSRFIVATNALAGLQWGALGTFLFPEGVAHVQLFVLMTIVCLVAGALAAHTALAGAHEVITLTALFPTAIHLFFLRDGVHAWAGAGALFLCGMMLLHARQLHQRLVRELETRIERDDLLALSGVVHDKLDAEKRDLEFRMAKLRAGRGASAPVK